MDKKQPISVNQSQKTGIVLNRMYTGSYLSSNLGHEVINMFQADNGKHYLYLNATGDFSEDYADKIGSMLLIKYSGQDESGSPWAEVLGCATGLHDVYRKNQYNKVEKQVEEYVVHEENGIETKISDITYNKAPIYKIFEGSDQQDVLISFYADNVKVPAEGCKIFLRFKASKDPNKGYVYYAASATKENKPKQFNGNITRLNDSPNEIGTYYLWKSKDSKGDGAYLFDESQVYVIEMNENFASTSLKSYVAEQNDKDNLRTLINDSKIWVDSAENLLNCQGVIKTALSIFNICQIENSENSISNALAFFMDKYRTRCCEFFKQHHIELNETFKISREVDSKIKGENKHADSPRSSKGRIDLLIEDDKNIIVIENKIKSDINGVKGDCDGMQLQRYHIYANWKRNESSIEEITQSLKETLVNGRSCLITLINENEIRIEEPRETKEGKKITLKFRNKADKDNYGTTQKYLIFLQERFKKLGKKNVFLFVLSPNYNKPHIQEYKKDDIGNEEWKQLTYWDIYDYIKGYNIDDDKNLVDFYNVIERHTKDNLCDWLKEDMKNRFLLRINELNA